MERMVRCPRCLNEDASYFYKGERGWYCRRCIRFGDSELLKEEDLLADGEYKLRFELTPAQKEISLQLAEMVEKGCSILLEAVCGAGKTELVYEMISRQLKRGHKVGFAIARRQVVLEVAERIAADFPRLKVVAVCQGHTDDVIGDLVVCTTHQLYRYRHYFDTLIIDEPDAFPFKNNLILHGIALNSCQGSFVYLTATPDLKLKERVEKGELQHLYLPVRPHGHKLCVPEVHYGGSIVLLGRLLKFIRRQLGKNKKVLLFVPTRKLGRHLYRCFRLVFNCCHVDSESEDRDEVIRAFRNKRHDICICTSLLERGVTFYDVQVAVYKADNPVFDEAALTQIAGRVGRSFSAPEGDCMFLCESRSLAIDRCLRGIISANDKAGL